MVIRLLPPSVKRSFDYNEVQKKYSSRFLSLFLCASMLSGVLPSNVLASEWDWEEPQPVHEHYYEGYVTYPTCTEPGYTTYYCECGDSYTEWGDPALGHDWDQGTMTLAPTEYSEGVMTYTCLRCGEWYEEVIPALAPYDDAYGTYDPSFPAYMPDINQTYTAVWEEAGPEPAVVDVYPEAKELVYTGSPQILVDEGYSSGGTILYALSEFWDIAPEYGYSADLPSGTDAGYFHYIIPLL